MTLQEIFTKNPELIEHEEVKKLIEFTRKSHGEMWDRIKKYQETEDKILELIMYSNLILIQGNSETSTLTNILNLLPE